MADETTCEHTSFLGGICVCGRKWIDCIADLHTALAAATRRADDAARRKYLVSCPWCSVMFADDALIQQQIDHLVACGDRLATVPVCGTEEKTRLTREVVEALAAIVPEIKQAEYVESCVNDTNTPRLARLRDFLIVWDRLAALDRAQANDV